MSRSQKMTLHEKKKGGKVGREEKKGQVEGIQHTQSAGSTPFPFNNLWFSSLVLPSLLSLVLNGSSSAAAAFVRSGNSVVE